MDASIKFDDSWKSALLHLREGQPIHFRGRLENYVQAFGIYLEKGELK